MELALHVIVIVLYATAAALAVARIWLPERIHRRFPPLLALGGWLVQTVQIGLHCTHAHTHDFSSAYENLLLVTWSLTVIYLLVGWMGRVTTLGAFVLPVVAPLTIVGAFAPSVGASYAVDMQADFILVVHVISAFLGYAAFFAAVACGLMFLVQERHLRQHRFDSLWQALPSLETLERSLLRGAMAGVGLFAISLGIGLLRARLETDLGASWLLNLKPLLALVTVAFFATLTGGRLLHLLRGRRLAWSALLGLPLMIATLLAGHAL